MDAVVKSLPGLYTITSSLTPPSLYPLGYIYALYFADHHMKTARFRQTAQDLIKHCLAHGQWYARLIKETIQLFNYTLTGMQSK